MARATERALAQEKSLRKLVCLRNDCQLPVVFDNSIGEIR